MRKEITKEQKMEVLQYFWNDMTLLLQDKHIEQLLMHIPENCNYTSPYYPFLCIHSFQKHELMELYNQLNVLFQKRDFERMIDLFESRSETIISFCEFAIRVLKMHQKSGFGIVLYFFTFQYTMYRKYNRSADCYFLFLNDSKTDNGHKFRFELHQASYLTQSHVTHFGGISGYGKDVIKTLVHYLHTKQEFPVIPYIQRYYKEEEHTSFHTISINGNEQKTYKF